MAPQKAPGKMLVKTSSARREAALLARVLEIVEAARGHAARSVNSGMVHAYWMIGREIVEVEQAGAKRAGYGDEVIDRLAERLTGRLGRGFGARTLRRLRLFYQTYPEGSALPSEGGAQPIRTAVLSRSARPKIRTAPLSRSTSPTAAAFPSTLGWTHYLVLLKVTNPTARAFYEIEAAQEAWSSRELERQVASLLFERLAKSRDKKKVMALARRGHQVETPADVMKEPFVLEFLGLDERAELARGDLRALYLGWLSCAQSGELDHDDREPPVPPGLGQLSASLEAMVAFLRIEPELLAVASKASVPSGKAGPSRKEALAWLATVPVPDKDGLLARLAIDDDPTSVRTELLRRLRMAAGSRAPTRVQTTRTVGALLAEAEEQRTRREELEARRATEAQARRDRAAAVARVKHLDGLAGKESKLWANAETLIATKTPRSYDAALALLVDLRDLAARGNSNDYGVRLEALRARHVKKPSFLERLAKAGLIGGPAAPTPSRLEGDLFASRAST